MMMDDDNCPGHDMTKPHIVIIDAELDGEPALMLCHYGWDVDEALLIMKHVTTMFHHDVQAYHASRN